MSRDFCMGEIVEIMGEYHTTKNNKDINPKRDKIILILLHSFMFYMTKQ